MNQKNFDTLKKDLEESIYSYSAKNFIIRAKSFYYTFQHPMADYILRTYFKKLIGNDPAYLSIDKFLLNEGGMFKSHVYKRCDKFYPIRNAKVFVPGIGYGRNLFQLAAFKPKLIVSFDISGYPEEWGYVKSEVLNKFNVEVVFYKGEFNTLDSMYEKSFDFIISDAVLEHVQDLSSFMVDAKRFLKDDGIFYASFGPLWYGPGGDHMDWGKKGIFDHLLLPENTYQENCKMKTLDSDTDSTKGEFMVKNRLFSYLSIKDYFDILSKAGFEKLLAFCKISTVAASLLKRKPGIVNLLNDNKIPLLDRFCSGIYLWAKQKSRQRCKL